VGFGLEAPGADVWYPDLNRSQSLASQALAVGPDLISRGLGLFGHVGPSGAALHVTYLKAEEIASLLSRGWTSQLL
jgi:hypothetical protein